MSEIPAWYWMLIIAGLSGMFGLILFYVAMLLRESMMTVREFRFMLMDMHDVMDTAKEIVQKSKKIVDTVSTTLDAISETILKPVAAIGALFNRIKGFTSKFSGEEVDDEID
ncbi:hypothetical protein JW710_03340 [Candidatus Dojkabacteria bacterium]|nr:hypothetical protein [Candidatus Dojkabacteria bacterium]